MLKTHYSQRSRQRLRHCVSARVSAHARVQAWTYDANNRLTQRGSSPCTSSGPNTGITCYDWDEAGNLTQKTEAGKTPQYRYDTQNRLIEVQDTTGGQTNPAATLIARYGYDPLDRRIWKEQYRDANGQGQGSPLAPALRTYYLYADEGLIAESTQAITLNADGSVSASSTPQISTQYGPRPDSEFTTGTLFVKTKNSNGQDTASPIVAYLHHDHLQTPLQATDKAGNVVWAASYNAFGKASITTPAATADKPTITVNLRLPGQYLDEETGLHYNWHRYYDGEIGRYTTEDPIGLRGGINRFSYVGGNPLSNSDPRGLDCSTMNGFTTCNYPGGPSFKIPAQYGFPDQLSSWHPLHHAYDVVQPLGLAESQCVSEKIKNNPTPGNPNPATPTGTTNNAEVGGKANWVTSFLTTDLKTGGQLVVNVTGPGSAFGPGYVARGITNGIVHTYGEGTHAVQSFLVPSMIRTIANELVWGRQMKSFVDECTCKR
jgi:RHS repeat-associated protein